MNFSPLFLLFRKEDNMTLTNTYSINVDIKRRMTSIVPTFSQGDSAVLKFRVYDNGKLMDMSDYTHSEVMFRQPSGRILTGDAELVNGEVVYTFTGLEMSEIGKLETILSVSSGSSTVSIQPFYCFIFDSMRSNNLEYIGILQELIKEVQGLELDVGSLLSDFNSFDYSPTTTYDFPNLVTYNGSTYIALKQVRGITPIDDKVNYRIAAQRGDVGVFEALSNEIRQKSQAANLAYKESYATLTALQNAYPTGNQYNHVVLSDGMIYTWANNSWVNTQIQANGTGIADNSITLRNTVFGATTNNLCDNDKSRWHNIHFGTNSIPTTNVRYLSSKDKLYLEKNKNYVYWTTPNPSGLSGIIYLFDANGTRLNTITGAITRGSPLIVNISSTEYPTFAYALLGVYRPSTTDTIDTTWLDSFKLTLEEGTTPTKYSDYRELLPNGVVGATKLSPEVNQQLNKINALEEAVDALEDTANDNIVISLKNTTFASPSNNLCDNDKAQWQNVHYTSGTVSQQNTRYLSSKDKLYLEKDKGYVYWATPNPTQLAGIVYLFDENDNRLSTVTGSLVRSNPRIFSISSSEYPAFAYARVGVYKSVTTDTVDTSWLDSYKLTLEEGTVPTEYNDYRVLIGNKTIDENKLADSVTQKIDKIPTLETKISELESEIEDGGETGGGSNKTDYNIIVASDLHWRNNNTQIATGITYQQAFDTFISNVNAKNQEIGVDFVVINGDMTTNDYNYSDEQIVKDKLVNELDVPVYFVHGNHDTISEQNWRNVFGYGKNYLIDLGYVYLICADTYATSVEGSPSTGYEQSDINTTFYNQIVALLEKYPKPCMLITHSYNNNYPNFQALWANPLVKGALSGHTHSARTMNYKSKPVLETASFAHTNAASKTPWGYVLLQTKAEYIKGTLITVAKTYGGGTWGTLEQPYTEGTPVVFNGNSLEIFKL